MKILYLFIIITLLANVAYANEKLALVVGNGSYAEGGLKNPVNDARDMTAVLISKGFEVKLILNGKLRQMEDEIRHFTEQLKGAGKTGLFYYAGHGIEMNGENYILPVDVNIQNESDVKYASVNVGRIVDGMSNAGNGLNIVILDACRNNPYASSFRGRTRGLQRMTPANGTIVLYAAEPGKVAEDGNGRNGTFTHHLLASMEEPGLAVEQVFKKTAIGVNTGTQGRQTPWFEGVILGDFYFTRKNSSSAFTQPREQLAFVEWQRIKYDNHAKTFTNFINKHKSGAYVDLAKQTLLILDENGSVDTLIPSQPAIAKLGLIFPTGKFANASLRDAKNTLQVNTRSAKVSTFTEATLNGNNVVSESYASSLCKQQNMDQIILGYIDKNSKQLNLSFIYCNQVSLIKQTYPVENRSKEKYPYEISIQRSLRDFIQMVTALKVEKVKTVPLTSSKEKEHKPTPFRPVW